MIKKLKFSLEGNVKPTILAPLTIIGEVLIELFIPYLMGKIIDIGIANQDIAYILKIGGLMVLLAIVSIACGAMSGTFASIAATGVSKNIRKKLFNKVQDFSFGNVDHFSTASLITRLTTDVTNIQNAFMMIIRIAVRGPLMMISAAIMSITINPRLSMIFLVAIPLLAIPLILIFSKAHKRFTTMLEKIDRLNGSVQENLTGIRVVKAFVRGDYEIRKFNASAEEVRDAQRRAEKLVSLSSPVMQLVMYGCMLAICWFGGHQIIGQTMETGEVFSFISYMMQTLMSFMMLAMIFVTTVLSMASVRRVVEVLDEPIDISDPEEKEEEIKDGSIDFNHVSFSYSKDPEKLALEDIDLHIRSGETIGIIGGTGSSKSTLVQLIPRLYDVLSGSVCVGGKDVRTYSQKMLRDQVAMVLQKNLLFSGTIRENLLWGNEKATEDQIIDACKKACAHDFIMSFSDQYDTDLGQGGVNVSGGQKQRLCIARALLKTPKTRLDFRQFYSAVDTATDASIRHATS